MSGPVRTAAGQSLPARATTDPVPRPIPLTVVAVPQPQAPLSGWQAAGAFKMPPTPEALAEQHEMSIVCPVLSAMVRSGQLPMAADGTVKLSELRAATDAMGLSAPLRAMLTTIGWAANRPSEVIGNLVDGQMNVLELRSGLTKHPSDSAVLNQAQFDEVRFAALTAHAKKGVMTEASFVAAIADNARRDLGAQSIGEAVGFGAAASSVEFSALLKVFGTKDPVTGELGISVDALRSLYRDRVLPPSNQTHLVNTMALQASMLVKADANLAAHALDSVASATGLARLGLRLSTEDSPPSSAAADAALGAGKAAACPYLCGRTAMPGRMNETVDAHTQARQ